MLQQKCTGGSCTDEITVAQFKHFERATPSRLHLYRFGSITQLPRSSLSSNSFRDVPAVTSANVGAGKDTWRLLTDASHGGAIVYYMALRVRHMTQRRRREQSGAFFQ